MVTSVPHLLLDKINQQCGVCLGVTPAAPSVPVPLCTQSHCYVSQALWPVGLWVTHLAHPKLCQSSKPICTHHHIDRWKNKQIIEICVKCRQERRGGKKYFRPKCLQEPHRTVLASLYRGNVTVSLLAWVHHCLNCSGPLWLPFPNPWVLPVAMVLSVTVADYQQESWSQFLWFLIPWELLF